MPFLAKLNFATARDLHKGTSGRKSDHVLCDPSGVKRVFVVPGVSLSLNPRLFAANPSGFSEY